MYRVFSTSTGETITVVMNAERKIEDGLKDYQLDVEQNRKEINRNIFILLL